MRASAVVQVVAHWAFAVLPIAHLPAAVAATCLTSEYQDAALVMQCKVPPTADFVFVEVQTSQVAQVARVPPGVLGFRLQLWDDVAVSLRLVDSTGCIVGPSCLNSEVCSNPEGEGGCIFYEGMDIYYSDSVIKVVEGTTRDFSIEVVGTSAQTLELQYAYGFFDDCANPKPGCAACAIYPGCETWQEPRCSGNRVVECIPHYTTLTTTTATLTSTSSSSSSSSSSSPSSSTTTSSACASSEYIAPFTGDNCSEVQPEDCQPVCMNCTWYAGCQPLEQPSCNGSAVVTCDPAVVFVEAALTTQGSSEGAWSVALKVAGEWSEEWPLLPSNTSDQFSTPLFVVAWPTEVRLVLTNSSDSWHLHWLRITIDWRTQYIVQASELWGNGTSTRVYSAPSDIFLRIEAETSTEVGAETASPCVFSVQLDSGWTTPRALFASAEAGTAASADVLADDWPPRLWLGLAGTDAWGYSELRVARGGQSRALSTGWLEGDGTTLELTPEEGALEDVPSTEVICADVQFQNTALVAECDGVSGKLELQLAAGVSGLALFPAGAVDVRLEVDESTVAVDLRLVDALSGACLVGRGCAHSTACSSEQEMCNAVAADLRVYFSGDKQAAETLKVAGELPRALAFEVFANATGSGQLKFTYGVITPCPDPLPGCLPCSDYDGCGPSETPLCNGSAKVLCQGPTVTTLPASSASAATTTTSSSSSSTNTSTTSLTSTSFTATTTASTTTTPTTTSTATFTTLSSTATTLTITSTTSTRTASTTTVTFTTVSSTSTATTVTTTASTVTTTTTNTSTSSTTTTTLTRTTKYPVYSCEANQYQPALLVASCAGGAGEVATGMVGGEVRSIASLPAGTSDVVFSLVGDFDLDLQVVDDSSGACIVGQRCLLSTPCAGPEDYCLQYQGMAIHYTGGSLRKDEAVKVRGPLDRNLSFVVRANAAGSLTIFFAHSAISPCPSGLGCTACPLPHCSCTGDEPLQCKPSTFPHLALALVLENVDYAQLASQPPLQARVATSIEEAVLGHAGEGASVDVELSEMPRGFVAAFVKVQPSAEASASALAERLVPPLGIADLVAAVPGIEAVAFGTISESGVRVAELVEQLRVTLSLDLELDLAALAVATRRRVEAGLTTELLQQLNVRLERASVPPLHAEDFSAELRDGGVEGRCTMDAAAVAATAAIAALLEAGLAALAVAELAEVVQVALSAAGAASEVRLRSVLGPNVEQVMAVGKWAVTAWSACASTCGEATRSRNVACAAPGCNGTAPTQLEVCEDYSGCAPQCVFGDSESMGCGAQLALLVALLLLLVFCLCGLLVCVVRWVIRRRKVDVVASDVAREVEPEAAKIEKATAINLEDVACQDHSEIASVEAIHCIGEPPGNWQVVHNPGAVKIGDPATPLELALPTPSSTMEGELPREPSSAALDDLSKAKSLVSKTTEEMSRITAEVRLSPRRMQPGVLSRIRDLESNPDYVNALQHLKESEDLPQGPAVAATSDSHPCTPPRAPGGFCTPPRSAASSRPPGSASSRRAVRDQPVVKVHRVTEPKRPQAAVTDDGLHWDEDMEEGESCAALRLTA